MLARHMLGALLGVGLFATGEAARLTAHDEVIHDQEKADRQATVAR